MTNTPLRILLLLFGVFACSTAVIMVIASHIPPIMLSALRLLVAAGALLPVFLRDRRRHPGACNRRTLLQALVPGVLLGIHFVTWIIGARLTPAANSSLIVNLVPITMPIFLYCAVRERITKAEALATLLALGGLGLLCVSDFHIDKQYVLGDLWCLVSMLLFSGYLVLSRLQGAGPSIWLYVTPLYAVAGLFCLVASPLAQEELPRLDWKEVSLVLGLGLVPTVMGHSILNYSMKVLRGQVVSILNMTQFAFSAILAFIFFGDVPAPAFYPACLLIVAGCVWAVIRGHEANSSA